MLHGTPPWNAKHRIVTIYECQADDFEKNADDKVLVGWLLTVKHHLSSTNSQMSLQGNMNSGAKKWIIQLRIFDSIQEMPITITFSSLQMPQHLANASASSC